MIGQKFSSRAQKRPTSLRQSFAAGICAMTALIASAWLAPAQAPGSVTASSNAASQSQKASDQFEVHVYAPSDLAVSSSMRGDHGSRQRQGRPASSAVAVRPVAGHNERHIPLFCFQPGMGWMAKPIVGSGQQNADNLGAGTASTDHLQIRHGASAGADECSPMSQAQGTVRTEAGNQNSVPELKNLQLNPGADFPSNDNLSNSLPGHSFSYTGGSDDAGSALGLPDLRPKSTSQVAADPSAAFAELKALQHRSYISPIKLRRLARNVQDLRARMELRQMNTAVEKQASGRTAGGEHTLAANANASGRKKTGRGPLASTADCERKTGASKSKVCAQLKR